MITVQEVTSIFLTEFLILNKDGTFNLIKKCMALLLSDKNTNT